MLNEKKSRFAGKTKLTISILLCLAAFAFVFEKETANRTSPSAPPAQGNITNQYIVGVMDCALDLSYSHISDLGLNLWHRYNHVDKLNDAETRGWDWYSPNRVDNLNNTLNTYSGVVTSRFEANLNNGLRTLMERPKIYLLAYGQRSDYQCESSHINEDLWFYAFNSHSPGNDDWQDNSQYGANEWVRRCLVNPNQTDGGAGWVVSRLKANSEQCNMNSPIGEVPGDKIHSWYVKPRIRADKNFVDNINNANIAICRIDVYNFDNVLIKSTDIRARNFKDENGSYNGFYKEEFRFNIPGGDSTLEFFDWQSINFNPNNGGWAFNSRGNRPTDGDNKMDIKVYWYGTCDMWLDYIRMDNDIADKLFKGYYEDPLHPERHWLQWEATLANYNSSPLKFYIEEFEFNHIPCMAYVSQKLKQYSGNPNLSLMSVVNLTQYNLHLPYDYVSNKKVSAEHIKTYLIDRVGESQVFSEPYSLTGKYPNSPFNDSKVPNTLMNGTYTYDINSGRLGEPEFPAAYDQWLQDRLDANELNIVTKRGFFSWYLKTMDTLSKLGDIPHINMPQTHLWYDISPQGIEECLREPTNEELEMTTLIPLTYGARGTIYFWFGGGGCIASGNEYTRGLTNPVPCVNTTGYEPRLTNVYGQLKWQKVKEINQKLNSWSPYIMSFNNADRKSYIYYSEMYDMAANTYIAGIYTYKPGSGEIPCVEDFPESDSPPANTIGECKYQRYVQAAVFKNPNEPSTSKYFMVVNRRCSPFINDQNENNNGGRRFIKMHFYNAHNDFGTTNNWNIYELPNERTPVTQFTVTNGYADLGWFMPGEGRLYKMVPAGN